MRDMFDFSYLHDYAKQYVLRMALSILCSEFSINRLDTIVDRWALQPTNENEPRGKCQLQVISFSRLVSAKPTMEIVKTIDKTFFAIIRHDSTSTLHCTWYCRAGRREGGNRSLWFFRDWRVSTNEASASAGIWDNYCRFQHFIFKIYNYYDYWISARVVK